MSNANKVSYQQLMTETWSAFPSMQPTREQQIKRESISNLIERTHTSINILSLSHTDLDGYMSQWVVEKMSSHVISKNFINPQYLSDYIITKLTEDKELLNKIDFIIITDLTPSNEALKVLSDIAQASSLHFIVIDHHSSAEKQLESYQGCQDYLFVYDTDSNGVKFSATAWASYIFVDRMTDEVFLTDIWDTWKWEPSKNKMAKAFNGLFYSLGSNKFKHLIHDSFSYKIKEVFLMDEVENAEKKDEARLNELVKNGVVVTTEIDNAVERVVVTTGKFDSSDADALYDKFDCDTVFFVNTTNVSMRTKSTSIRLDQLATSLGGGGHQQAAGFSLIHTDNDDAKEFGYGLFRVLLYKTCKGI